MEEKNGTLKKSWFKSTFNEPETSSSKSPHLENSLKVLSQNSTQYVTNDSVNTLPEFLSSNWIENFAPENILDLAVNSKKIEELQDWFMSIERSKKEVPAPILLLTGPSGVGKTVALKLIAKNINYEITEWITPIEIDLLKYNKYDTDDDVWYKENQIDKFEDFLFKGSRYPSLYNNALSNKLLLVEDFPNIFLKNPSGFTEILERFIQYGKAPLIFIVTESRSKNLNLSYNLFPEDVRTQFNITNINFNATSTTMLKKGLKRICIIMGKPGFSKYYKQPTQDMIDSIILSSQGDIRSAVLNLHFASQKNAPILSTIVSSTPSKKIKTKNLKLKTLGRDENITLMHALGRVFNPKFIEDISLENKKFLHSPEDITDLFVTQPKHFLTFIQTNYLNHFQNIENVSDAASYLCDSDILLNEYMDDAMSYLGLNIAIRGIMYCNTKPLGGWKPIRGFKRLNEQENYKKHLNEQKEYGIETTVSRDQYVIDYKTYAGIIRK